MRLCRRSKVIKERRRLDCRADRQKRGQKQNGKRRSGMRKEEEGLRLPRRACFILGLSMVTVAVRLPLTETWLHPSAHTPLVWRTHTGSLPLPAASPRHWASLASPLSPQLTLTHTHTHTPPWLPSLPVPECAVPTLQSLLPLWSMSLCFPLPFCVVYKNLRHLFFRFADGIFAEAKTTDPIQNKRPLDCGCNPLGVVENL